MHCSKLHVLALGAALLALALLAPPETGEAARILPGIRVKPRPLPEFLNASPEAWINSKPIRLADLRGQVVLIEIWTTA